MRPDTCPYKNGAYQGTKPSKVLLGLVALFVQPWRELHYQKDIRGSAIYAWIWKINKGVSTQWTWPGHRTQSKCMMESKDSNRECGSGGFTQQQSMLHLLVHSKLTVAFSITSSMQMSLQKSGTSRLSQWCRHHTLEADLRRWHKLWIRSFGWTNYGL